MIRRLSFDEKLDRFWQSVSFLAGALGSWFSKAVRCGALGTAAIFLFLTQLSGAEQELEFEGSVWEGSGTHAWILEDESLTVSGAGIEQSLSIETTGPAVLSFSGEVDNAHTQGSYLRIYIDGELLWEQRANYADRNIVFRDRIAVPTGLVSVRFSYVGSSGEGNTVRLDEADLSAGYLLAAKALSHGNVSVSPDKVSYRFGEKVTILAEPEMGFNFANWMGHPSVDLRSRSRSVEITIGGHTEVMGAFLPDSIGNPNLWTGGNSYWALSDHGSEYWGGAEGAGYPLVPYGFGNASVAQRPAVLEGLINGTGSVSFWGLGDPYLKFFVNDEEIPLPGLGRTHDDPIYYQFDFNENRSHVIRWEAYDRGGLGLYGLKVSEGIALQVRDDANVSISPRKSKYAKGDTVILNAKEVEDRVFLGWGGYANGDDNPVELTLRDHAHVVAIYADDDDIKPHKWKTGIGNAGFELVRGYIGQEWLWKAVEENGVGWLEMYLDGPGILSFKIRNSGAPSLRTLVNGIELFNETGGIGTDDREIVNTVPLYEGMNTIRWEVESETASFEESEITARVYDFEVAEGAGLLVSEAEGGSVEIWPTKDIYEIGENVSLRVSPRAGFEHLGWTGDVESTESEITITLDKTYLVKPIFGGRIDHSGHLWSIGGTNAWKVQDTLGQEIPILSITGMDRSRTIDYYGWVEAEFDGPGVLSFESYRGHGYLTMFLDGEELEFDTMEAWSAHVVSISDGTHSVRWRAQSSTNSSASVDDESGIRNIRYESGYAFNYPLETFGGEVQISVESGVHPEGTVITGAVNPLDGYVFNGWGEESLGNAGEFSVTLNQAYELKPQFVIESLGDVPVSDFEIGGESKWKWGKNEDGDYYLTNPSPAAAGGWIEFSVVGPGVFSFYLVKHEQLTGYDETRVYLNDRSRKIYRPNREDAARELVELNVDEGEHRIRILNQSDTVTFAENFDFDEGYELELGQNASGTIVSSHGEGIYQLGERIELTADPVDGYVFDRWRLDANGESIEYVEETISIELAGHTRVSAYYHWSTEEGLFYTPGLTSAFSEDLVDKVEGRSSSRIVGIESPSSYLPFDRFVEMEDHFGIRFWAKAVNGTLEMQNLETSDWEEVLVDSGWMHFEYFFESPWQKDLIRFRVRSTDGVPIVHIDGFEAFPALKIEPSTVGGSVQLEPDKTLFKVGEEVALKAIPDEGNDFLGWFGALEITSTDASFTVEKTGFSRAYFTQKQSFLEDEVAYYGESVWEESNEALTATLTEPGIVGLVRNFEGPGRLAFQLQSILQESGSLKVYLDDALVFECERYDSCDTEFFEIRGQEGDQLRIELELLGDRYYFPGVEISLSLSNWSFQPGFELKIDPPGGGSVLVLTPHKERYDIGETVNVSLLVEDGVDFHGWTGDLEGQSESFDIVMSDDLAGGPILTKQFSHGGFLYTTPMDGQWYVVGGSLYSHNPTLNEMRPAILRTKVNGMGVLSFDWIQDYGSGSTSVAIFKVAVDGQVVLEGNASDDRLFRESILVGPGEHVIEFQYVDNRDDDSWSSPSGSFGAQIRNVQFYKPMGDKEKNVYHWLSCAMGVVDMSEMPLMLAFDWDNDGFTGFEEALYGLDPFAGNEGPFGYLVDVESGAESRASVWFTKHRTCDHLHHQIEASFDLENWLAIDDFSLDAAKTSIELDNGFDAHLFDFAMPEEAKAVYFRFGINSDIE